MIRRLFGMGRKRMIEVLAISVSVFILWYVLISTGVWSWYFAFMVGMVVGIAMSEGIDIVDVVVVILAFPVLLVRDFILRIDEYKYNFAEWRFKRKLGVRNDWDVTVKVREVLKKDDISVDRAYIRPIDESGEAEYGWPGIVVDIVYDDAERLKREYGEEWYRVVEERIADGLGVDVRRIKVFQAELKYW